MTADELESAFDDAMEDLMHTEKLQHLFNPPAGSLDRVRNRQYTTAIHAYDALKAGIGEDATNALMDEYRTIQTPTCRRVLENVIARTWES